MHDCGATYVVPQFGIGTYAGQIVVFHVSCPIVVAHTSSVRAIKYMYNIIKN